MVTDAGVVRGTGCVVLLLGALGCLASMGFLCPCGGYFRKPDAAVKTFTRKTWVRAVLHALAGAWLLLQLLRIPAVWGPVFDPNGRAAETKPDPSLYVQRVLCRVYVAASAGLVEPGFLAAALLFLRSALHLMPSDEAKLEVVHYYFRCVGVLVVQFGLQCIAAWLGAMVDQGEWEAADVAPYVYEVALDGRGSACATNGEAGCILCIYSFVSTAVSGVGMVVYLLAVRQTASRMRSVAINRQILQRLRVLEVGLLALLPGSVAARACILIPQLNVLGRELVWLGFYLVVLGTCAIVLFILSILPTAEAKAAARSIRAAPPAYGVDLEERMLEAPAASEEDGGGGTRV